jgi:predicted Rossmann fold nucleotide-binding protein DprA/Smf involved in DNA uptake
MADCVVYEGEEVAEPDEYLKRNRAIVDGSEILVATPKEEDGEALRSGTWATVRYARKMGRVIYIVRPSGVIEIETNNVSH